MDYETMRLLSEADRVVQSTTNGSVITLVGAVVGIGVLVLYVRYILDRWTWAKRAQHNRKYREMF